MESYWKDGLFYPDDTPVEVPLHLTLPPTTEEMIRRVVREQMSMLAEANGFESFEESDDFEVDEDPDPLSRYEVQDMMEEYPISDAQSGDDDGQGRDVVSRDTQAGNETPSSAKGSQSDAGNLALDKGATQGADK